MIRQSRDVRVHCLKLRLVRFAHLDFRFGAPKLGSRLGANLRRHRVARSRCRQCPRTPQEQSHLGSVRRACCGRNPRAARLAVEAATCRASQTIDVVPGRETCAVSAQLVGVLADAPSSYSTREGAECSSLWGPVARAPRAHVQDRSRELRQVRRPRGIPDEGRARAAPSPGHQLHATAELRASFPAARVVRGRRHVFRFVGWRC